MSLWDGIYEETVSDFPFPVHLWALRSVPQLRLEGNIEAYSSQGLLSIRLSARPEDEGK
jgi:hypothetical protein